MAALPKIARARVEGWLIEEMAPPGQEIVIGGLRDPQFGPLVMVGLGGIFVEVLGGRLVSHLPDHAARRRGDARRAEGRGDARTARAAAKPASREAIVDVLLKIGGEDGLAHAARRDIERGRHQSADRVGDAARSRSMRGSSFAMRSVHLGDAHRREAIRIDAIHAALRAARPSPSSARRRRA